jgi:hypothetical protein
MIFQYIGEALIYLVGLPLFALQTFEGLQALIDVFNQIAQQVQIK